MTTATQEAPVTVFTTPTCPWCGKAKDFLRQQGVPFQERDIASDRAAAMQVMNLTHQMGVPVVADSQEAIIGFDLPRLQRMAARHRRVPGLGLRVADAKDGPGAVVGSVREDSPGARAGIQAGDVVEELSGRPVTNVADLESIAGRRVPGQPTSIMIRRHGERSTLILPG